MRDIKAELLKKQFYNNIKLDYDTLPNGKSELCDQCCSMIDSEQSYYFNSNCDQELYFDHPSCVELYYLTNKLESI